VTRAIVTLATLVITTPDDADTGDLTFAAPASGLLSAAADDEHYFYAQGSGLRRGNFDSGENIELVELEDRASALQASGDFVYFSHEDDIYRLTENGSSLEIIGDTREAGDGAFTVTESTVFWSGDKGILYANDNADGDPLGETLDQRGAWDNDDYEPMIAADDVAVYWVAGPDPAVRSSDGDPLSLFVACL